MSANITVKAPSIKVVISEKRGQSGVVFNKPFVMQPEGFPNDGKVRVGAFIMVHTSILKDNTPTPYIFKGWCIQEGSTNWFDQQYYTEDFN